MNRMQHPSNNFVLGAPADWDQKALPCNALPVTRTVHEGKPVIVSFWMPTAEELALIKKGTPIQLWLIGHTMPPASLTVGDLI